MRPSSTIFLIVASGIAIVLAVGWIAARFTGRPRTIRVSPQNVRPGPIRHAQLSADLEERIRKLEPVFADVYSRTHEEWLDGFQRDANPESEIAIWEAMAAALKAFAEKRTLTPEAKKDAFSLLLLRTADSDPLPKTKLRTLTRADAEELLKLYTPAPQPVLVEQK